METFDDLVRMGLQHAPDEPQLASATAQADLHEVDRALEKVGLDYTNRMHFRTAGIEHFGEYAIPFVKMTAAVASVVIAWLHGRAGRKVRFEVGDVLIEARTREDVEALISRVSEAREVKVLPSKPTRAEGSEPPTG